MLSFSLKLVSNRFKWINVFDFLCLSISLLPAMPNRL